MKLIKLFEEYNDEYYTKITVDEFKKLDRQMISNLDELTPIEEVEAEWLEKTLLSFSKDIDFLFCYYDQKDTELKQIVNNKQYKLNNEKNYFLHQRWIQNRVLGLSLKRKPSFIIINYKKTEGKFSEIIYYIDIVKLRHEDYLVRYIREKKSFSKSLSPFAPDYLGKSLYFRCEGLFGLGKLLKNLVENE